MKTPTLLMRWEIIALQALVILPLLARPAYAQESFSYGQMLRPQFHFSPAATFTNDPNGLVFYRGRYHLFYQQRVFTGSATGSGLSCCDWGHAVSPDLVHWEQRPAAISRIPASPGVTAQAIFSGSAVVDWNNTSGFGIEDNPPMVAIYTLSGGGQSQGLAYSTDEGDTWTTYTGNPVLTGPGGFRDPKVFWYEPLQRWTMVIWQNAGMQFYTSPDLKDWTYQSVFEVGFECPDFFPLAVDDDPDNIKWVMFEAVGNYWVGDFDGTTFTPDQTTPAGRMDYGTNYYAAQTFSDTPGRRILVAWISTGFNRNGIWPELPWMGAMTVARELSLRTIDGRPQIVIRPVPELMGLRGELVTITNKALPADTSTPLDAAAQGNQLDIEVVLDPGTAARSGLRVLAGQGLYTTIGYDAATNVVYIDRSQAGRQDGIGGHGIPDGVALPDEARGRPVLLRVLVDRSTIEVYADGGTRVLTSNVLPLVNNSLTEPAPAGTGRLAVPRTTGFQSGQTLRLNADANGPRAGMQEYTLTNVGTGAISTALAAPLTAGATNLKVADVTNFEPGRIFTVGVGAAAQTFTVGSGGVGTAAANPTSLFIGASAGAINVKVASVNGFAPGASVVLGTGEGAEVLTVADGGVGTQGRNPILVARAAAGDTNLKLSSVVGLDIGAEVIIGMGTDNPETRTIVGPVGANGAFNGTAGTSGSGVSLSEPLSVARDSSTTFHFLGTGITLSAPLTRSHVMGVPAQSLGSGITVTAAVAGDHAAGEAVADSGTGLSISPALTSSWPAGTPFGTAPAIDVEGFAVGGAATITARVWTMRSIWPETHRPE